MIKMLRFRNWIPFLLIASFAIFSRVYAIDRIPPGLFGDEAVEGLDALDVMAGNFFIWFHAHLGREPIYVYLTALSYQLFGVTALATRLPALIAGLLTLPAAFLFTREWASAIFSRERATRLAWLATALVAISFWHIEMTRNAHRDTLLPLVEALGYWLLWRAFRTRDWKPFAASGAILGLAVYTYSPGRFVGVFVALFVAVEFIIARVSANRRPPATDDYTRSAVGGRRSVIGIFVAGIAALVVMLPLAIYFAQNPAQFVRRFDSTSVFDQGAPVLALATSVVGNLAQFVIPGAGYQSWHYNLPGKPVFDLLLAPWFLAGLVLAVARARQSQYRFLLLWFVVMLAPAFLTDDMIPKGVRVLGVAPGVFIIPALAMDWLWERALDRSLLGAIQTKNQARFNRMEPVSPQPFAIVIVFALIAISFVGSAAWTAYDYFVAWANAEPVPLRFDADYAELAQFVLRAPTDQPIYISAETYRHPTYMLLGRHISTSNYLQRATRIREFDARTLLVTRAHDANALYVIVRENKPPFDWLTRVASQVESVSEGTYLAAYRYGNFGSPPRALDIAFNPFLKLTGVARFDDEPAGIVLYWQVTALPDNRDDIQTTLTLADTNGKTLAQKNQRFGYPPLEWQIGDVIAEWYEFESLDNATQFSLEMTRGKSKWQSPLLSAK
ncbi:MAG: glycosyltransferase family 39 protein [Chloroflexi bacterium]|nr:glycosyltransferase family 39 protein [Chloroflexota bacterium]